MMRHDERHRVDGPRRNGGVTANVVPGRPRDIDDPAEAMHDYMEWRLARILDRHRNGAPAADTLAALEKLIRLVRALKEGTQAEKARAIWASLDGGGIG